MMQDGQTATNPSTGEKIVLRGGQWVPLGQSAPAPVAPVAPDRIYGAPKAPDPVELERLSMSRRDQDRQDRLAPIQEEAARLELEQKRRLSGGKPLPEGSAKTLEGVAGMYRQLSGALNSFKDDYAGNLLGGVENAAQGFVSGIGTPGQRDWWAAFGSEDIAARNEMFGATLTPSEQAAYASTTINPTMDAAEVRRNLERRVSILKGATTRRVAYLKANGFEPDAINALVGDLPDVQQAPVEPKAGGRDVMFGDEYSALYSRLAPSEKAQLDAAKEAGASQEVLNNLASRMGDGMAPRYTPDQEAKIKQAVRDGDEGLAFKLMQDFNGGVPPDRESLRKTMEIVRKNPNTDFSLGYQNADQNYQKSREQELYGDNLPQALEQRKGAGVDAAVRGLADTGSFGISDELSAGLNTLFGDGTMRENLQRERAVDEADRRVNPGSRFGGQIAGGFLNPIGRGATTPGQMARAGAVGGGLYGAGSGTDLTSRSTNALLGAGGGAAGGYAIGKGMNALAPVAQRVFGPSRAALRRADEMAVANEVAAAARSEGVPVSRGLLDPKVSRKVTALETMPGSGEVIQEGLDATREGLRAGVSRLGQGGNARDSFGMGEAIQGAGRDFIKRSRTVANRLYDRAEKLGGSTAINPQNGLKAIRDNIMELRATPEANKALIGYMEALGKDMSGGITVSALRNLRTQMRGQISERNLTASDAERRVIGILDAASDDIADAFKGNPAAATAYARADKLFKEKQTYIKDVVQKFIGRRDSPISAEDAWRKFEGMAKDKDSRRLAEMMRALDPDEARDVAATFADQLGRNRAGEFTAAQLVTQAEKLSDRAKLTIFGPQGKQSLDNLVTVARGARATLNASRTGVANNYQSWVANVVGLIGAAGGAGLGSTSGTAGAGFGAVAGGAVAKMAADKVESTANAWTARALMSPEITKWLASAPKTTDPAAINAHIKRLSSIGARNPQLAEAVASIERRIVEAIGQLPPKAAADQGQEPKKP